MRTKAFFRFLLLTALLLAVASMAAAQGRSDGIWAEISETSIANRGMERQSTPSHYRVYRLNQTGMQSLLVQAPHEFSEMSRFAQTIISLPMPDGSLSRFRVERSYIVEPGLLRKYPELGETFRGQGIDDPTATVRFDFLPSGFHALILSPRGTVVIDPYAQTDRDHYLSYYKRDAQRRSDFACEFDEQNAVESIFSPNSRSSRDFIPDAARAEVANGTHLRTYRLAVAATGEYTAAVGGGTVAGALAAQVLIMNRVNGVYERDVAMRMVMIENNDEIIYTNSATDPYSNNSGSAMLGQNQSNLDSVIGSANYDIGHVFSTGGGGVATLNGPCGSSKARGVTGLPNPTGDIFAIDFVAHEMGHQWGANHTFNASCGGNRSAGSAYEPGSGVTILGYAGVCGSQDLAGSSIDSFHVKSIEAIIAYSQSGNGNSCAVTTPTGNTPPTVNVVGGPAFNIPRLTPFTLTAEASDVDGDTVTYDWQQYDLGSTASTIPNSDADGVARPIFRPFSPTASPSRTFPAIQHIRNTANVPPATTAGFQTGEILPAIARTMNFQVIARDNRSNGGGVNTATATVTVSSNGPFKVTGPNTNDTWHAGQSKTITWDTANSQNAPINTANVRILLSTDGGNTFPTVITESTPNDGSYTYTVPAVSSSQARIKIEAVGNIFFDMSDVNFTITATPVSNGLMAGRITDPFGRGLPNVRVTLTGGASPRYAVTNSFGYYRFETVPFGVSYTITPQARKGYTYEPGSIAVPAYSADAANMDFTASN